MKFEEKMLKGLIINESVNMEPNPDEKKLLQDQGVKYQDKKLLNMSDEVLAEFDENTKSVKYEQDPKGGVLLTVTNKDGSEDRYVIQGGHIEAATAPSQPGQTTPDFPGIEPGIKYGIFPKCVENK